MADQIDLDAILAELPDPPPDDDEPCESFNLPTAETWAAWKRAGIV